MKKTILIGITLSLFIVILPLKSFALFYDSFENYNLGNLDGQGNWWEEGSGNWQVNTNEASQGNYSIYCDSSYCRARATTTQQTTGTVSTDFYLSMFATTPCESISTIGTGDDYFFFWQTKLDEGTCKIYKNNTITFGEYFGTVSYDNWHNVMVEYKPYEIRFKFNDEAWTEWQYSGATYFNEIILDSTAVSKKLYFDNIDMEYSDPFITSFDETEFFISYPTDCRFSTVSYTTTTIDFNSIGHFTNPPLSGITYDDLNINFYNSSGEATSSHIEGISYPNSDLGWANEISLPKDNYRVEYTAEGYDNNGNYRIYTHYCSGTGVGYEKPTGSFDWWGTKFDTCAGIYDQCIASSTNFLETSVCNIMGFGLSLVCPSPAVLKRSWAILDDVKTRFPISYINIVKTTFSSDLSATNLSATSSATTSMVGVNLSGYEKLGELTWISNLKMIAGYAFVFSTLLYVIIFSSKNFFN